MSRKDDLSRHTATGVFWMILGSGGQTAFQFVLFVFLARQLGPEAFGLLGLASIFVEISSTLSRTGLTEVLVQRATVSDEQYSTAFWSAFGVGLFFAALQFFGAGAIAQAFGEPELALVMKLLAPVSVVYAMGAVYEARLMRSFGFRALAGRNVTATLVSGMLAMVMAFLGLGVLALVFQRLVHVFWMLGAMVVTSTWRPTFTWQRQEAEGQLRGGSVLALSSILISGNQRMFDLILGYSLGAVALGYFRIAWRGLELMTEFSIRQINAVALSSLSRLQHDLAQLRAAFLNLVHLTAIFIYPLFLGAAVVAPELIRLMFGRQWEPSVVPMQIMTLIAIPWPLVYYRVNVCMAVGAIKTVFLTNLLEFTVTCVVAFATARSGLEVAAAGSVLRLLVILPIMLPVVQRAAGIPAAATIAVVCRPLLAASTMIAVLVVAKPFAGRLPDMVVILVLAILGLATYSAALWVIDREKVREIVGYVARWRAAR